VARSFGATASAGVPGTEKVLHSFKGGTDGASPSAGLIELAGTLYGTTKYGGGSTLGGLTACCGTVFKITTAGSESVLHRFVGGTDGAFPQAGLVGVGGTLYGTTSGSTFGEAGNGPSSSGTVFKITTSGVESVLHRFAGPPDGEQPDAGVIDVDGTLYGTTVYGGDSKNCGRGCGTVFAITTSGKERVLYSFKAGEDGANPDAGLVDIGGALYGTTFGGGRAGCATSGCGTVFAVTTSGKERVLYRFTGAKGDGAWPSAGLASVSGSLYGTNVRGGHGQYCDGIGCGTVFKIEAGKETILHRFPDSAGDGLNPSAGLIELDGKLYGTTSEGVAGAGTVFEITTSGAERIIHTFDGGPSDGSNPLAGLVEVGSTLYGTTYYGGSSDVGTVFSISL
jgi:uncharacterized repeat protein (TIGR03803 family)